MIEQASSRRKWPFGEQTAQAGENGLITTSLATPSSTIEDLGQERLVKSCQASSRWERLRPWKTPAATLPLSSTTVLA
jgi:hypothetical protein